MHILRTVVQTVIRAVSNGRAIINFVGINRSVVSDDSIRKRDVHKGWLNVSFYFMTFMFVSDKIIYGIENIKAKGLGDVSK